MLVLFFRSNGALFQRRIPSLRNVDHTTSDLPLVSNKLSFLVLCILIGFSHNGLVIFNGHSLLLVAFHNSVSLILAFIWLTYNMSMFCNSDLVDFLSEILVPFRHLTNLFWIFWIASKSPFRVSLFSLLTFPRSCIPYLILEIKRLSDTFLRD